LKINNCHGINMIIWNILIFTRWIPTSKMSKNLILGLPHAYSWDLLYTMYVYRMIGLMSTISALSWSPAMCVPQVCFMCASPTLTKIIGKFVEKDGFFSKFSQKSPSISHDYLCKHNFLYKIHCCISLTFSFLKKYKIWDIEKCIF